MFICQRMYFFLMPSSLPIFFSFFLPVPISLCMSILISCTCFLQCSTHVPHYLSVCLSIHPSINLFLSVLLTFCFILYVFAIYLFPYFYTTHSKSILSLISLFLSVCLLLNYLLDRYISFFLTPCFFIPLPLCLTLCPYA